MSAESATDPSSTTSTSKPGSEARTAATPAATFAASLYAGMTTRQSDMRWFATGMGTERWNVGGRQRWREPSSVATNVCANLAPDADLRGLRLPVPVDGRRRGALGAQPGGGAGRRRARGHLRDAPAVGPGRPAADPGRPGGRRGARRGALRPRRQPPDRPGAALRPRRSRPPAAPRPRVRPRALRDLALLRRPGRRPRTPRRALPPGRRLGRGVERPLLERLPRRPQGPDRRRGAARGHPHPPGRVLLQRAARAAPARARPARRARPPPEPAARGEATVLRGLPALPVRRPVPQPAEPLVVFAGRHIPEKN